MANINNIGIGVGLSTAIGGASAPVIPALKFRNTDAKNNTIQPKWTQSGTMTYSLDEGVTWTNISSGTTITVAPGKTAFFRGTFSGRRLFAATGSVSTNSWAFPRNGEFAIYGDINCLLNTTGGDVTLADYAYARMLADAPALKWTIDPVTGEQLVFPSKNVGLYGYGYMFTDSFSLKQFPIIQAVTLANYAMSNMFQCCSSVTDASTLLQTVTSAGVYAFGYMFATTNLKYAPISINLTTASSEVCIKMFNECYSLLTTPLLPATTLGSSCYSSMFNYCQSITKIPVLPATTLANNCYAGMFYYCTGLRLSDTNDGTATEVYRLPASGSWTGGASNSVNNMFYNVPGTRTAPTYNMGSRTYYQKP